MPGDAGNGQRSLFAGHSSDRLLITMRTSQYSTAALIDLFRQQTVATLAEVMTALGTGARRTAFRKLKEIPYRASYSHRGRYYTP